MNEEKIIKKDKAFYNKWYIKVLGLIFALSLVFNSKFSLVFVSGSSMEPTYKDKTLLLSEKYAKDINRFDNVVLITSEKFIIKRVIGLPGDIIEYNDDKLYINNKLVKDDYGIGNTGNFKTKISDNCYFCLGDNREHSLDSRYYGEFPKDSIYAKIIGGS